MAWQVNVALDADHDAATLSADWHELVGVPTPIDTVTFTYSRRVTMALADINLFVTEAKQAKIVNDNQAVRIASFKAQLETKLNA